MDYEEFIAKVLKGRTVNAAAKAIGIPQPTLSRYVKAERVPDFDTGLRLVQEAGVDVAEGFAILAKAEREHKVKGFKLQHGIVQISILPLLSGAGVVILSILC